MDDFMVHRSSKKKHSKTVKSFKDLHGSKSPMSSTVGGDQLGHDKQLPVNPVTQGGSPLLNPGQAGALMGDPGRIGEAMGNSPSGEDYY